MDRSQKVLIIAGLLIAVAGMLYGLWYAIFDEHQTLEQLGGALANSFVEASNRDLAGAVNELERYRLIGTEYSREVHAHSHWITLSMILIVLGLAYERVNYGASVKLGLAVVLSIGSFMFPLGVLLQNFPLGMLGKLLAQAGSLAVILSFLLITIGLFKPRTD